MIHEPLEESFTIQDEVDIVLLVTIQNEFDKFVRIAVPSQLHFMWNIFYMLQCQTFFLCVRWLIIMLIMVSIMWEGVVSTNFDLLKHSESSKIQITSTKIIN